MYWIAGLALLASACVAIYFAARNPAFWIALGSQFIAKMLPDIREYFAKRNTPEVESEMARCVRAGGEWDNFRKKCRYK